MSASEPGRAADDRVGRRSVDLVAPTAVDPVGDEPVVDEPAVGDRVVDGGRREEIERPTPQAVVSRTTGTGR